MELVLLRQVQRLLEVAGTTTHAYSSLHVKINLPVTTLQTTSYHRMKRACEQKLCNGLVNLVTCDCLYFYVQTRV